jgi:hypothetical protein
VNTIGFLGSHCTIENRFQLVKVLLAKNLLLSTDLALMAVDKEYDKEDGLEIDDDIAGPGAACVLSTYHLCGTETLLEQEDWPEYLPDLASI